MKGHIFEDKEGEEKIFSIWYFAMLALVGVGVIGGVLLFYSADVDAREVEVNILQNRLGDCLLDQGYLDKEVLGNFDVFSGCDLSRDVFSQEGHFYFRIRFLDDSGEIIREEISGGDSSFEKDCEISSEIEAEEYPYCVEEEKEMFYFSSGKWNKGILEILAGSNQKGERRVTYEK